MRAGDLSKLEISKTFYTHFTRVASFDFGEIQTWKTIFWRSGHLYVYTIQSLKTVYFSVLSNNRQTDIMNNFFRTTSYKKNSIFCRQKKFTHDFIPHFCSFCERFIVLQCSLTQSTCGKSNQFTNLQTHSGLEGILSN